MDPLFASSIFFLGLAFGSFLNVVIYRLPWVCRWLRRVRACPGCKRPIAFYDNLPVLSWLILRRPLPSLQGENLARYLFIELLTGVLFPRLYAYLGLTLATLNTASSEMRRAAGIRRRSISAWPA